ncbi:hypothetical protein BASA81_006028 [Batrachochytrium salamandrivorans]|nr:hypothetical protein BASA81_006028 [Batrachochytrium salamandrivorans]
MQFFCLLSFAVVALHAAALPQPAGLSEKYSNSADTNLASGLEARSYQPALNPQQDSVTSMLLKRQDDSEGYSGDDGESDPSSPPVPTSDASNGETVIPILKSGLDDAEYSRVELSLRKTAARLIDEVRACLIAAFDAISNIIEKTGDVAQNVETVAKSFERVFNSRMEFFEKLKLSLEKFAAGEGFRTLLSNIGESINRFMGKQRKLHDLDQRWLDGTVEHESMGTRHDNRVLGQHGLADFLQVAYRQYQSTLWKYHRDRLVEVG